MSIAANDTRRGSVLRDGRPDQAAGREKSPGRDGPAGRISADEELVTLTEATRSLPKVDGRKVAVSTLWRWCRFGLRGTFLEYVRVGRRICTTREALLRFFSKLAELDDRIPPDTRSRPAGLKRLPMTSRQRQRALAEADAILEGAGI